MVMMHQLPLKIYQESPLKHNCTEKYQFQNNSSYILKYKVIQIQQLHGHINLQKNTKSKINKNRKISKKKNKTKKQTETRILSAINIPILTIQAEKPQKQIKTQNFQLRWMKIDPSTPIPKNQKRITIYIPIFSHSSRKQSQIHIKNTEST